MQEKQEEQEVKVTYVLPKSLADKVETVPWGLKSRFVAYVLADWLSRNDDPAAIISELYGVDRCK